MSGVYGQSFASKLIEDGQFEEAAVEATRAIERDAADPEPWLDRATALSELGRYGEAVGDYERALELDRAAHVLNDDFLDDAYFSALLGAARSEPVDAGVERLERYRGVLPRGRHLDDAVQWQRRLRGELKSEFVKIREE